MRRNSRTQVKGQSLVEFAFVLPLFLLIFLGIIDFGITMHMWSTLNQQCVQAARTGSKRVFQMVARNVYTSTTHETLANVQNSFWFYKSPLMATGSYSNLSFNGVGNTSTVVKVSADYTTTLYTPFLGAFFGGGSGGNGGVTLHAYAEERKE